MYSPSAQFDFSASAYAPSNHFAIDGAVENVGSYGPSFQFILSDTGYAATQIFDFRVSAQAVVAAISVFKSTCAVLSLAAIAPQSYAYVAKSASTAVANASLSNVGIASFVAKSVAVSVVRNLQFVARGYSTSKYVALSKSVVVPRGASVFSAASVKAKSLALIAPRAQCVFRDNSSVLFSARNIHFVARGAGYSLDAIAAACAIAPTMQGFSQNKLLWLSGAAVAPSATGYLFAASPVFCSAITYHYKCAVVANSISDWHGAAFYNANNPRIIFSSLIDSVDLGAALPVRIDAPVRSLSDFSCAHSVAAGRLGGFSHFILAEQFEANPIQCSVETDCNAAVKIGLSSIEKFQHLLSADVAYFVEQFVCKPIFLHADVIQAQDIFIQTSVVAAQLRCADYAIKNTARVYGFPAPEFCYTPATAFAFDQSDFVPGSSFVWSYQIPFLDYLYSVSSSLQSHFDCNQQQSMLIFASKKAVQIEAINPPNGRSQLLDPVRVTPPLPENHEAVFLPTRDVYFVNNSISIKLRNGTELPVFSVNLSLDADSFSWRMSASIEGVLAWDLVNQAPGQSPIEIEVTINNYFWVMVVKRALLSRTFERSSINIECVGLTYYLGQPILQPTSVAFGVELSAQQIVELLMPDDWTIDWSAATFNLPAGVYSHTRLTPIQAVAQFVAQFGAIVRPHQSEKIITVMPRYPVLPWNFGATTPDYYIPEAIILSPSTVSVYELQADAVYVHGHSQGILARCRLNGTAGNRLAPTISNSTVIGTIAARALGERILSGQYIQPILSSCVLPLGGDMPLLDVGDFCDFELQGEHVRAVISGVSIAAKFGEVRQIVQLGDSPENLWSAFAQLIDKDPLLVGTIASTNDFSSVLSLFDGGTTVVRGTGIVGKSYFFKSGAIQSQAPDFDFFEIVV